MTYGSQGPLYPGPRLVSRWCHTVWIRYLAKVNANERQGGTRIWQRLEADMNGNNEFVGLVARDKQDSLVDEAREHRLAKQAGTLDGRYRALEMAPSPLALARVQ